MSRFYLALGGLAVAGAVVVFLLIRQPAGAARAARDAPVAVTEYSDFECPFCASFAAVQMPTIKQQLIATGKARWRYRDFPLPSHQYSRFAAHAAQCAGEQGKFWEMHDQLFYNHSWAQTGKNPAGLFRDFARAAGVDPARYDACMDSGRYAARIEFSRQEGDQRLVDGTPTFFVNGERLRSTSYGSDVFKHIVDSLAARRK